LRQVYTRDRLREHLVTIDEGIRRAMAVWNFARRVAATSDTARGRMRTPLASDPEDP